MVTGYALGGRVQLPCLSDIGYLPLTPVQTLHCVLKTQPSQPAPALPW